MAEAVERQYPRGGQPIAPTVSHFRPVNVANPTYQGLRRGGIIQDARRPPDRRLSFDGNDAPAKLFFLGPHVGPRADDGEIAWDLAAMGPTSPARLAQRVSESGADPWIFESKERLRSRLSVSDIGSLSASRPGSLPGRSIVVVLPGYTPAAVSCFLHLRKATPLLPILCFLPHAKDPFDSEVLRTCALFGLRVSEYAVGKGPDLSMIESVLRQEPAEVSLDVIAFLERRGHELRWKGHVIDFIEEALHGGLREVRTPLSGERRRGLTELRNSLRRASLPPPRRFGLAVRLLAAGIRLYSPVRPRIDKVARSLGFSSPFSLSNEMVRYLGRRPGQVRELYPWEWMLDRALPEPPGQRAGRG